MNLYNPSAICRTGSGPRRGRLAVIVTLVITLLMILAAPAQAQDPLPEAGVSPVGDDAGHDVEETLSEDSPADEVPAIDEDSPDVEPMLATQMIAPFAVSHLTATKDNPTLPDRCGVNAAVVIDLSNSIGVAGLQQSKAAAKTVADAVAASGGYLGLYDFATLAPARQDLGAGWMPLFSPRDLSAAHTKIDGLRPPAADRGGTNWEGGLNQVLNSGRTYDFVYFITDGVPTANNDYEASRGGAAGTRADAGSIPHFADLDDAIQASNSLKSRGSYVIPVAVGINDDTVPVMDNSATYSSNIWGGASRNNTRSWNGTYYNSSAVNHYRTARQMLAHLDPDFVSARDYDQLVATMNAVLRPCQATVVIEKQVVDARGTAVPTQSQGWTFTATNAATGLTIQNGVETTRQNGLTREIALKTTTPATQGTVEIRETAREGYRLRQQSGSNAVCSMGDGITFDNAGGFTAVAVTNIGADGMKVPVRAGQTTHCVVQNQQINGAAAISQGPRPGEAVEVDAEGRAELVYTVQVSSTGTPRDVHTGEIRQSVLLPPGVIADRDVTVAFSAEPGVLPTGVAATFYRTDFTAGRELRLAENLLIPTGKKATFTITVPVRVIVTTGAEWDRLQRCDFAATGGYLSGGVPNGVIMDNDTDGAGNNIACIPLVRTAPAAVTVVKTNRHNTELTGARFALYAAELDAAHTPTGPAATPLVAQLPTADGSASRFVAENLREGTYYLVEVQAPEGHSLLSAPVGFHLERDATTASGYRLNLLDPGGQVVRIIDDLVIQVADTTTAQLPASGGEGVTPYALAGALILAIGVAAARRSSRN